MISAISSTPALPATRAITTQSQTQTRQEHTSDTSRGAGDTQGNRPASGANAGAAPAEDVSELAATDREVRAHEAAHLAAAGGLAKGGATFETVRGPDGRSYAVGGEVSIDVSPGRTPEETIAKAEQIRRAALAPADPSAQDFQVAAQAAQMAQQARQELALQQTSQPTSQRGPGQSGSKDANDQYTLALASGHDATATGTRVNILA